jgi:predicted nucleotidyltransferase
MAKTSSKINKIAKRFVTQLENKNIQVQRLILFGSHAAGKAKQYSDIDIAVISPAFENKGILKRQELLGEAIYPLQEPIEALGFTPREYANAAPMSFLSEIIVTGKVLYEN